MRAYRYSYADTTLFRLRPPRGGSFCLLVSGAYAHRHADHYSAARTNLYSYSYAHAH